MKFIKSEEKKMNKYTVVFLLYLVASTQAINCPEAPEFSNGKNACSHRLHKRETEEVHSIDIHRVKEKLREAYQEIRPLLENIVEEIAPSIQEEFTLTYLPAIRSFRDEVMPFVYAKVYPQLQKYYKVGLNLGEKFIEKAHRSYKLSNSTHLAISDLIEEAYNEAKPLIQMGKYLSARMTSSGNYRGKREVYQFSENFMSGNLEEVHVIDIQKLTDKLIEAYHSIKPLLEEFVAEITPSVYEKFSNLYLPKLREMKNEISPFFQAKVYPQVQKYMKLASNVAEKLVDKAYRSYELSNSTHINIVSISDIIEEVYSEMKPILDLGKYLSMRMKNTKHYRAKRDLSGVSETTLIRHKRQMPDFLFSMISPFLKSFVDSIYNTMLGGSGSILSKVVLPLVYDIMGDPESRFDAMRLYMIAKSTFSPLLWELMKRQTFNTPEGTIIKIPRHFYDSAVQKFEANGRPILRKLMNKHIGSVFGNLRSSTPQVVDFLDRLMFERYEGADILKDQVLNFMQKHRNMFKTSSSTHVNFYSLTEIMNDFKPIKISAVQILLQYLKRKPNSWLNAFFGDGSILQRLVVGEPVYAQPSYAKRVYAAKPRASPTYRYVKRG